MCGIAGIVALASGPAPERPALERMLGALRHRGPDEFGLYRDRRAGLAHARLSIIDLTGGQQPLCNEDESLWIVFNGEIFNYIELRAELEALGHRFRTRSDTEVIVHAWEAWGEGAFARMNGQWALALWDARAQRLVLARDRLGIRPLYYSAHAGRLSFASEVKALFAADPDLPRAFDPVGLDQTFTFWSVVPPRSVFAGVSELEPGHLRVYELGAREPDLHVTDRAYWQPGYPETPSERFRGDLDQATQAVRAALEQATALRMLRADVPVGSYLSGGLDSSLVAAMGLAAKGERFHTFSIRFEDAEYDETGFQRLMADRLGTDHHEFVMTRADIARVFPDVVLHAERPILRTAPAPMFALSRLVREVGIKVVLTGEGADEMFAGYDLFREGLIRRFWAREPTSEARPLLLQKLYPYLARSPVHQQAMAKHFFGRNLDHWRAPGFAHDTRWHTTSALKRLVTADMHPGPEVDTTAALLATLPEPFSRWSPLAQDQYLEVRTLLAGYILASQGDRMLMAHSVEGRFPFLDCDVVELANHLPDSYKLRALDEKHILKRVARELVPAEILDRKKQPYRAPDALAFVGPGVPAERADQVATALSDAEVRAAGVFDPGAVAHLWKKCQARAGSGQFSNTDNMALVGVLSTQLLHQALIRAPYPATPPAEIRTVVDRCDPAGRDQGAGRAGPGGPS
ncbi:asparagine synthase (glutamine-hydrolyzing) [Haliangium sp.]|uniref:asparagine synthase (glutamine-hydrolyzing) n=1 Tax=Haliangium sp. TaxID=2663208 RepID=UPI003D0A9993